jgi:hypothetical protein
MVYLFAKRPKKDQTLMSWKDVRGVSKHGANKLLIAEQFLEQNPKLKPFFTRHHEKEVLAEKIFKSGGGESRSKWDDRWGYTEKELLKDLEAMGQEGMLTRREMIRAADSTLKSTGRHKREYMREIYAFKRGKKDTVDTGKADLVSAKPRQALASLRGIKKDAIDAEGTPPTVLKKGIVTVAPTGVAPINHPKPFLPGQATAAGNSQHHFLEGVTARHNDAGPDQREKKQGITTGSINSSELHGIHRSSVAGLSTLRPNRPAVSGSDTPTRSHADSLSGGSLPKHDAPSSLRHGKVMRPGEVGSSSFPKNTGTSGLKGNVSSISRFLDTK